MNSVCELARMRDCAIGCRLEALDVREEAELWRLNLRIGRSPHRTAGTAGHRGLGETSAVADWLGRSRRRGPVAALAIQQPLSDAGAVTVRATRHRPVPRWVAARRGIYR